MEFNVFKMKCVVLYFVYSAPKRILSYFTFGKSRLQRILMLHYSRPIEINMHN